LRVAAPGPDCGERDVTFAKQFNRSTQQTAPDPTRPECLVDVNLRHFRLETRSGIEEHTPAQADHLAPGAHRQDDVLPFERRARSRRKLPVDLLRGQLRMIVMTLLFERQLAE
jgi:hypothetical protein